MNLERILVIFFVQMREHGEALEIVIGINLNVVSALEVCKNFIKLGEAILPIVRMVIVKDGFS